ncbi:MAG: PfkB family carbohydrate kinase [Candidatus Eisenbacteria bacterium]
MPEERGAFKFDVVGLGLNAVDHLCVIPRFPRYEEKLRMTDFKRAGGGQVASALVACSRWGLKAKYIGKVGGDEMGEFSYGALEKEGIDLNHVVRVDGALNQFAFILVDARTGERTIIWRRDKELEITPDEVPAEAVKQGEFLLLDGHDSHAAAKAAAIASEAGVGVVVDAETVKPGTGDMIQASRYVVCSQDFPRAFTGESDVKDALRAIKDTGPVCVVSTLGKEGAMGLGEAGFTRSQGFKVDCIDSTGAGDVFHGAFVYGLTKGWELQRILDFSNAAAALNCTVLGARGGIRPVEEIFDLIEMGERW